MTRSVFLMLGVASLCAIAFFSARYAQRSAVARIDAIGRDESATVRFSWQHESVAVGIDRSGDGSDPFIERAVGGYRKLASMVPPK